MKTVKTERVFVILIVKIGNIVRRYAIIKCQDISSIHTHSALQLGVPELPSTLKRSALNTSLSTFSQDCIGKANTPKLTPMLVFLLLFCLMAVSLSNPWRSWSISTRSIPTLITYTQVMLFRGHKLEPFVKL